MVTLYFFGALLGIKPPPVKLYVLPILSYSLLSFFFALCAASKAADAASFLFSDCRTFASISLELLYCISFIFLTYHAIIFQKKGGDFIIGWLIKLNTTNEYFSLIVSLSGIFGFILSVWLLIKSNSINKTLKIISQKEDYNKNRNLFADRFSGFKDSILQDNDHSSRLFHSILEDVYRVEKEFHSIFSIHDKWTFLLIKHELKKDSRNIQKICTYLDYVTARLRIKED